MAANQTFLDIVTNDDRLQDCVRLLESPHAGLVCCQLGTFRDLPVTLNIHHDDSVSIVVDGPALESARNQAFGFLLNKEEVLQMLTTVLIEMANGGRVAEA